MAIFTGGKSRAISSPRHLTLRHSRRKALHNKITRGILPPEDDDQPILKPGEEKLNSFWAPGLEAGPVHTIVATQTVKAPGSADDLVLVSEQDFYVDAPQFSLPEGSVYSCYPPSGYPEDHRILPHVVLSDPHLPWERRGSPKDDALGDKRNKVPWLALFTFTQDELRLAPDALGGFQFKQTPTLAVNMTVEQLWDITTANSPVQKTPEWNPDVIKSAKGDFIFMKPDLFKSLFSTFGDDNKREVPATPATTKYKYLAHVRNINTTGMAVAGVEDVGIFSVVVGSRSGPLVNEAPVSVSVHLVSIEGVEDMKAFPDNKPLMALCSLHSWNYTVNPPGMLNVHDAFVHLGTAPLGLNLLRAPDATIEAVSKMSDKVSPRLAERLKDGYSLVKYRVQTGEETVALYRSPFTPTVVAPLPHRNRCSNSGQDLQILDREVGIMDVTYSVAWQVGRLLALGDQGFTAALARFRTAIHTLAMKESKIHVVRAVGGDSSLRRRVDVLENLKQTVSHLRNIHLGEEHDGDGVGGPGGDSGFVPGPPKQRWRRNRLTKKQYPQLGFNGIQVKDQYLEKAKEAAYKLSMGKDGKIYDETNDPVSTDWMQLLAWVMDRMFLSGVPAHYLISDPSHLPHEGLRFFYIDPNWVDAMIDGALSLANHNGEDRDRVAIKLAINRYIHHIPEHQTHPPQIPTYGFYMRSDLVTMYPDLKVTTNPPPPDGTIPDKAPLLRHEIVSDGVMLGLLDRLPGATDFDGLVFTQPPHQQRFAAGYRLSKEDIGIEIWRQYTVDMKTQESDPLLHKHLIPAFQMKQEDQKNWFTWNSDPSVPNNNLRVVRLPFYAEEQARLLQEKMERKYFDDGVPNSALLAMQLNDPFYRLIITAKDTAMSSMLEKLVDTNNKPRALQLIEPSHIRRLIEGGDKDDDHEGEVPESTSVVIEPISATSLYTRHESYQPPPHVFKANLAPHINSNLPLYDPTHFARHALVGIKPPGALASTDTLIYTPQPEDPAGPPIYDCAVYSTGSSYVKTCSPANALPQDLVFSIQVSNTRTDYRLTELQIIIPLGEADDADSHTLFPAYDGPGPRMLSNLRFVVLPAQGTFDGQRCLVLRILPRSANGWTAIRLVKELSFLLCLAQVNNTFQGQGRTFVTLYTAAYYKYVFETQPRQGQFTVTLRNTGE
ncbi:hypothetical protein CHGG_00065 [Chaetomium globosum CBS 148.51]|uniref:Uncharacterized protein n=1 Tax=Chaetomium globosum (strain ATCC 6205 / CBS 148.51 / DSM 1962 / NBRC 6347 / NRRL 1970) TaxID=306901 RepID=Q2HI89_CHAGB|nr:uncharacterized protein CHGG_00065 [Chaetomium globosum CBS 148.51]EAQ91830.1 hypothetical protein CHGG_00065 [Chaetomium globosum CBS 148.51]